MLYRLDSSEIYHQYAQNKKKLGDELFSIFLYLSPANKPYDCCLCVPMPKRGFSTLLIKKDKLRNGSSVDTQGKISHTMTMS